MFGLFKKKKPVINLPNGQVLQVESWESILKHVTYDEKQIRLWSMRQEEIEKGQKNFHPVGDEYERMHLREDRIYIGSMTKKKYWVKCGILHHRILENEKSVWVPATSTRAWVIKSQLYKRI